MDAHLDTAHRRTWRRGLSALLALVSAGTLLFGGVATSAASATITDLGTLGGTSSNATAISQADEVIGASTSATGGSHAFVWAAGAGLDDLDNHVGYPTKFTSVALAINVHGAVLGY